MLRKRITKLYILLIAFNVLVWTVAMGIYAHHFLSLGLCFLAYSFGLRHGLDADHITAIDNVTRKLVDRQNHPITVGFFFSLGHALVVVCLSIFIVLTASTASQYFPSLNKYGALFGGLFAGIFLLLFAGINFYIFWQVWQGERSHHAAGFLSIFFKPLLRMVRKSWHMLIVGFLFGLGFDTATEVALLGLSGHQMIVHHTSLWVMMIFPALFAAGMCLVDTTGGLLIMGACRWAYINAERNRYYNLIITAIAFVTALLIGIYELVTTVAPVSLHVVDAHFTTIGLLIILIFLVTWTAKAVLSSRT